MRIGVINDQRPGAFLFFFLSFSFLFFSPVFLTLSDGTVLLTMTDCF
jgi:hypothetical protein